MKYALMICATATLALSASFSHAQTSYPGQVVNQVVNAPPGNIGRQALVTPSISQDRNVIIDTRGNHNFQPSPASDSPPQPYSPQLGMAPDPRLVPTPVAPVVAP